MSRDHDELERIDDDVDAFLRSRGEDLSAWLSKGLPPVPESGPFVGSLEAAVLVGGRYRLDEEIGRGAQGVVYRASDTQLDRSVALKVLHPFLGSGAESHRLRFEREARAASRLDHDALCPVLDSGEHRGLPFIVMKLLTGTTLARLIGDSDGAPIALGVERAAALFEELARGLDEAHEEGVFHRDVKPWNIVVDESGRAVLLDFGCAREDGDDVRLSVSGDILGTIAYMPPERIEGAGPWDDRRADVYSLGISLYECLSGSRPFDGHNREATVKAVLESELPAFPRECRVPRDLDVVVRTAAAREPTRRYVSAGAFADDLRRFLDGRPIRARRVGAISKAVMWSKRNPVMAGAATMIAAGAVIVAALWLEAGLQRRRADSATEVLAAGGLRGSVDDLWPMRERRLAAIDGWLDAAKPLAGRLGDVLPKVRGRREFAASVRKRSLEDAAGRWHACRAELGDFLPELSPTVGLVPLGRDPRSGLQEFLHLDTHRGPLPARDSSGRLPFDASTGIVLVLVPGGETFAGAQRDDGQEVETYDKYLRSYEGFFELELDPYFISKYEITLAQWQRVMDDEPNRYPLQAAQRDPALRGLHPVEMVSWEEAAEFVRRLDLRLPTEPEWEHAARGDGPTTWWRGMSGPQVGRRVNAADATAFDGMVAAGATWTPARPDFADGHHLHAPVNTLEPNAYGLHHVVGNVWEWCLEWSLEYGGSPSGDVYVEESRRLRPLRGGSFESPLVETRIAAREHHVPRYRSHSLGLRPALSLEPGRR